ncbi:MAG: DUF697 domain-containing protein [Deltaproteobacteria bacterium]|nr:DUF697 domain-containing protein [Deltaproteobacteria bacterium]
MSWLDTLEEIRKRDWTEAPAKEREAKSREVVNICAYAASVTAVVPVPLADLALLLPVHSVMVMTVGHIYGRKINQAEAKRIALELGAVAGLSFAGLAAIGALKRLLLPAVGGLLSIPATFALSWGLGRASMTYFERPELSRDELKKVFEEAIKEGKSVFSPEAFERFRQKNPEVKVAPEPTQSTPPPAAEPSEPRAPADESLRPKKRTL